jgi:hypothetical protein
MPVPGNCCGVSVGRVGWLRLHQGRHALAECRLQVGGRATILPEEISESLIGQLLEVFHALLGKLIEGMTSVGIVAIATSARDQEYEFSPRVEPVERELGVQLLDERQNYSHSEAPCGAQLKSRG